MRNNFLKGLIYNLGLTIFPLLPDSIAVGLHSLFLIGRWPNISNPKRYTEKIQWYKLNYRDPLMTICADKYLAKDYLSQKGFSKYVPELYQVCDRIEDVVFENLPNSFIIKCNNGYGANVIVRDKTSLDISSVYKKFKKWKKLATVDIAREWAYKNIPPKIIVEELLISNDGTQQGNLNDYKVMCFNGTPKVIWVDVDRYSNHKRNFYDTQWNLLPVKSDCPVCEKSIPSPFGLDKMLEIASSIAKDFPFVRVDFYSVNQEVYIGELTFYPWSGCVKYAPDSFDFTLGEMFVLPEPKQS